MSSFKNHPDIVQMINGNFGKWQLRTIVLIFLCKIPTAWFTICVIYTAPTPQKGDYYCKPADPYLINNNTFPTSGNYRSFHLQEDIQSTDRQFQVDACHTFKTNLEANFAYNNVNNYSNPFDRPQKESEKVDVHLVPCDRFDHNSEYESLVTQFDLVCSRELLVSVTQAFHALGALIGGLVANQTLK